MKMQIQSFVNSFPENIYPPSQLARNWSSVAGASKLSSENALINSILRDDKSELVEQAQNLVKSPSSSSPPSSPLNRSVISRLLHLCCQLDSANSASALINGEVGGVVVPVINEIDACSGKSPLHTAAENHSGRCIELLLRKRARTDLKTKAVAVAVAGGGGSGGGRGQRQMLALELALRCSRMEVDWGPDEPLDDLLVLLSEKELSAIRLLAEKTMEVGEVAYSIAMEGHAARLAALLMVAGERVNGTVLNLRANDGLAAEKLTVYKCVIKEAVSIFSQIKQTSGKFISESKDHLGEEARRKLLLREMELLHFFGASPNGGCGDKKATSPLILASQAGDEEVMELLLKTDIDINETDSEGNSSLHWSIKAWKTSSPEQIRILSLLLKHGARVRQKNMLGLTAVHIASGNGNLETLEILLSQDPDTVHVTSEFKETPLFLAAKNDHIDCAQLLLRFGATPDVHNLRRERPIDLAKSQDMRTALSRTSVVITNRAFQQKYTACVQSDKVVSETCEVLLLKEADHTSDSFSPNQDGKVCKYYGSPTGCIRGSKCFYKHGEEELPSSKSRVGFARSEVISEFRRKIFVGGLPPTVDSETLKTIMEEQFGPVADARVLEMEIEGQIISRGFGFVCFKHENTVTTAVEAHYINIWGKRVEIKSAIPKCLLSQEDQRDEEQDKSIEQENSRPIHSQPTSPGEKISGNVDIPGMMSWADKVANGKPAKPVNELKGQNIPGWLSTLRKWLPPFLRKMSANLKEGEFYSLSSLKADFKSIFGLELDHASLGYPKLSDFIKSLPELCRTKMVHTGGHVANHMILLPNFSRPTALVIPKNDGFSPCQGKQTPEKKDDGVKCQKTPSPKEIVKIRSESDKTPQTNMRPGLCVTPLRDNSRFLQFLEPDPIFLARTWLGTGGFKTPEPNSSKRHLVLEALARKRKEVFVLRSPMFYSDYVASVKQGACVACEKNRMIWANYPCQHLLWCGDCKLIAMKVAPVGTSDHKCVVCDHVVEKIDLVTRPMMPRQLPNDMEFLLQIHAANLKSQRLLA